MFLLLTTLALAQDADLTKTVLLDSTATDAEAQEVELDLSERGPGYSLLISKRAETLLDSDEEIAWGQVTAELATSIRLHFATDELDALELVVTPTDADGFPVGEPEVFDIQAALGRGTRDTSKGVSPRTELL